MTAELGAAIDVGTNTALLLVGRLGPDGELEVVEDRTETPRMGAGLARTGTIAPEAFARTVDVLELYAGRLAEHGVPTARRRVVGTAALRRAGNADELRAAVRERTGLELEVLPEEDEARLGYLAVQGGGAATREVWIVDVGGGSTELVCDGGRTRSSVPIGAVVLTEAFLGAEPPRAGGWEGLVEAARAGAAALPRPRGTPDEVVVLGGTGVNLACLDLGLERFDHERAEGHAFRTEVVAALAARLAGSTPSERARMPIESTRVEILPAGLACLGAALSHLGVERARVSGRGLRYGVLRELLTRTNTEPPSVRPKRP